jgi:hypothetical protein
MRGIDLLPNPATSDNEQEHRHLAHIRNISRNHPSHSTQTRNAKTEVAHLSSINRLRVTQFAYYESKLGGRVAIVGPEGSCDIPPASWVGIDSLWPHSLMKSTYQLQRDRNSEMVLRSSVWLMRSFHPCGFVSENGEPSILIKC